MKEDNKNQNNEQQMMLIHKEKNDSDEEDEDEDNGNENPNKNIGKNIIYKNKYIFGIKTHLFDLISLSIFFIFIYVIFLTLIFPFFYSQKFPFLYYLIIISLTFSFFLALDNQILCFLIEPGIVPKKYPTLKIRDYSDKIIYSKITKKPIIRIQRNCAICSIRRPKKCQHCFFCDNCIEEFDHHCQYVSNCIGKRNKKFFLFFILFAFIFLSKIYLISFLHFCFSFKLYKDNIIEIYNKIYLSIIFLGFIIMLLLANLFFHFDYNGYLTYGLYIANFVFIIHFYLNKDSNMPKFISPFNIVFLNVLFKWIYYFLTLLILQMKMVALNMTSSQYRNLITYLQAVNNDESHIQLSEDNNINSEENNRNDFIKCVIIKDIPTKKEIPKFNFNNLIKNIKNIIFKDIPPSLIH